MNRDLELIRTALEAAGSVEQQAPGEPAPRLVLRNEAALRALENFRAYVEQFGRLMYCDMSEDGRRILCRALLWYVEATMGFPGATTERLR